MPRQDVTAWRRDDGRIAGAIVGRETLQASRRAAASRSGSNGELVLGAFTVMWVALLWFSPLLPAEQHELLKYALLASVIVLLGALALSYGAIWRVPAFLTIPVAFAAIGAFALVYTRFALGRTESFASGLLPMLVCAIPLFVPPAEIDLPDRRIVRFVVLVLMTMSIDHVALHAVERIAGLQLREFHERSFVIVFYGVIAASVGMRVHVWLALALGVASLVVRPSSTLLTGLCLGAATCVLASKRGNRAAGSVATLGIVIVAGANLAIVMSADFRDALFGIEPLLKEQFLGGQSNNGFRLALAEVLHDQFYSQNLLTGQLFLGEVNIRIGDRFQWWRALSGDLSQPLGEYAPVHSDFQMFALQGGIIGFSLFTGMLVGFARKCCGWGRALLLAGDAACGRLLYGLCYCTLTFSLYMSFNPLVQHVDFVVFFLWLMPLAVLIARMKARQPSRARFVAEPLATAKPRMAS